MKTKDQTLLEEAYKSVNLNESSIPSETFDRTASHPGSYCIFISANKTKEFNDAIAQRGLDKQGVRVLKADFNNETAVIVIPFNLDYHKIEKDLYALPASKDGFWGQLGMGYAGKSWSVVK